MAFDGKPPSNLLGLISSSSGLEATGTTPAIEQDISPPTERTWLFHPLCDLRFSLFQGDALGFG